MHLKFQGGMAYVLHALQIKTAPEQSLILRKDSMSEKESRAKFEGHGTLASC